MHRFLTLLLALCALPAMAKTPAEILKDAPASDWRPLDLNNTLLMDVGGHGVLIELAPRFAPEHAKNIRILAHEGFWDGTAIVRVQDNFVTQWGDPDADDKGNAKSLGSAAAHLPAEFSIPYAGLPIAKLPDPDGWAPVSGFVDGFPVAADPKRDMAWITHCYGVVGAGRNMEPDSSTGAELYVIIGQSPRSLDLNITVVGRVLVGMEYLSALPRGGANMGFYDKPEQRTAIGSIKLLADIPEDQRPKLQVLKTDSKSWKALVAAKRNSPSDFYRYKANFTNVCNMSVPVR